VNIKSFLTKHKIDVYLVPMKDEFGSEYLPKDRRFIEAISGFTGSNAFIVLSNKKNAFFTDGRYTTQAKLEVDSKKFEIFDLSEISEVDYLLKNLPMLAGGLNNKVVQKVGDKIKIGFNPSFFSVAKINEYKNKLGKNFEFKPIEENFLIANELRSRGNSDKKQNRFLRRFASRNDASPIIDVEKYAGKSRKEKLKEIFKNNDADYIILTNAESVNWLLNIRGHDLPNTPVCLCYAIISKKLEVDLYFKNYAPFLPPTLLRGKARWGVEKPFADFFADIKKLKNKKISICEKSASFAVIKNLEKAGGKIINTPDPTINLRGIKNKTEIQNIKKAHILDGVALTKFFFWLENSLSEKNSVDEIKIAEKLIELRSQYKNFVFPSFDTIAGFKENGAIIHYRATEKTNKIIAGNGLLLIDSGGQYFEGTTDVTRTISIGKPSKEQVENFTLVLKGHINIANIKILKGTSGNQIDILARQFLWDKGLDYKHGTGHGVGYFLNVHEGPHGISKYNKTPLEAGMVISNEPGFYKEGAYGIRIENLVLTKQSKFTDFLEFETLTKVFIDKNLIDVKMLEVKEIKWLNDYQQQVYDDLKNYLSPAEQKFLKEKCKKITY
jgi:Xaa-Pro aminopeptidase